MTTHQAKDAQAFTISFSGRVPRIVTALGVSDVYDPQGPEEQRPPVMEAKGLWDTGATGSAISKTLAKSLSLTPEGQTEMTHAGGKRTALTYVVNLHLPNRVMIYGMVVSDMPDQPGFDLIVGMNVICQGDLSITNVRGTTMSFRTPSIAKVDYVEETNRARNRGIGRNSPCPCNSGKKFKKCHGRAPQLGRSS